MATQTQQVGKIVQIIGPVVDVEFEAGHLPEIYHALRITMQQDGKPVDVVCEGEQHLGENALGRMVIGRDEPVDFPGGPVQSKERCPIHRPAPTLENQSTELKMFE